MSLETRSNSALYKRAEQLRRWEESETNRELVAPCHRPQRVDFPSGCIFLSACATGDKEEVLDLVRNGADIDTPNVDGLTALHQACIDDNLDMVEFLVEHGADVNRGDNEGWTPLHATASCGFLSIAKYLMEHGADVAAINNDGELPLDITQSDRMEQYLKSEIDKRGIDCKLARSQEERQMLSDAREWLATKSNLCNLQHPKTGATALHVASAKGYTKVIKLIIQCGADVDKQDFDGWTPMHAAAYWGQKDAAQILAENLADMDIENMTGQTAFEVADTDSMFRYLQNLKDQQNKEELNRRQAKKRSEELDRTVETETPSKLQRVEVEIDEKELRNTSESIGGMDASSESESETETSSGDTESISVDSSYYEKKNRVNSLTNNDVTTINNSEIVKGSLHPAPAVPPKPLVDNNTDDNVRSWRRPISGQTKAEHNKTTNSFRDNTAGIDDGANENEMGLKRTNSFQNDPEFYVKYQVLRARIQASSLTYCNPRTLNPQSEFIIAPSNNVERQSRSISNSKENLQEGDASISSTIPSATISTTNSTTNSQPVRSGLKLLLPTTPTPTTTTANNTPTPPSPGTRLQIIKNFFKSFVPPTRDDESETQRKAHAKRVRETRRSTQGVTLEEIKSAEQLVKKQIQATTVNNNQGESSNGVNVVTTITTATPTVPARDSEDSTAIHERRPSWRLRVDNGSKFKLEDATSEAEPPSTPSFIRRLGAGSTPAPPRPSSTPAETTESVTLSLRRPKSLDNKEHDKENDARYTQPTLATQAAIQRRKRPKRRSTGVVAFDNLDDLEGQKDLAVDGETDGTSKQNHELSGTERTSRSSRLGSANDIARDENGEIDYKKLYEQSIVENDRLKDKLRKSEEELRDTKQTLEKLNTVTSKNSLSELEKRERRAMERKLSEMEEELKQLELLKSENTRLKDENGALIRVISKLSK